MGHGHHHHHHHHSHSTERALSLAFFLNLIFSVIELIGGILTNSSAIIADAFHDFMDAVAIGTAYYFEKLSKKKRTDQYTYGYKRFNLVSALGLSIFLLVGASLMIYHTLLYFKEVKEVHSIGMLAFGFLGVLINGAAFWRMKNEVGNNANSRAVMLHLLEDVLGWVAVIIGAIIIYFTKWYWIDHLLTLGIGLFISINALKNIIHTMKIMLQSVPEDLDVNGLSIEIKNLQQVEAFHDLHVWTMDGNYHVASIHVLVDGLNTQDYTSLYQDIRLIMEKYNIQHPTIQIETMNDTCHLENC